MACVKLPKKGKSIPVNLRTKMRLIILLALLVGVLYCLHILVQDYQALTAPRLLRMLFKRDVISRNYTEHNVRWKKILQYDPIQCARYLYCDIGAHPSDTEIRRGFQFMLTLTPDEEDRTSHEEFKKAHLLGRLSGENGCRKEYYTCPFRVSLLFEIIQYLLNSHE